MRGSIIEPLVAESSATAPPAASPNQSVVGKDTLTDQSCHPQDRERVLKLRNAIQQQLIAQHQRLLGNKDGPRDVSSHSSTVLLQASSPELVVSTLLIAVVKLLKRAHSGTDMEYFRDHTLSTITELEKCSMTKELLQVTNILPILVSLQTYQDHDTQEIAQRLVEKWQLVYRTKQDEKQALASLKWA